MDVFTPCNGAVSNIILILVILVEFILLQLILVTLLYAALVTRATRCLAPSDDLVDQNPGELHEHTYCTMAEVTTVHCARGNCI